MTTTVLAPYLTQQFFGNNGAFLASGQLFTYAGGTNTPLATYIDNSGGTPNTNPIILNARGECSLWLPPNVTYKFQLQDPAGNIIWTRDNVVQNQLLSLFGGVDTGGPNAYVLNYVAPFTGPIPNGTVIYWVPSNSNTGASTLNVNGTGALSIVNIDGSPLGSGQITAGATTEVMFYNGVWQLLSVGSFVGSTVGTFGTEVPIASAATCDLGSVPAHVALITGTTTITSFGNSASLAAPFYFCRVQSSLQLTYDPVAMILPGNASIVTLPGDAFIMQFLGSGSWKLTIYQTALGGGGSSANAKIKPADTQIASSTAFTLDPDLVSNPLIVGRYQWTAYLIFDSAVAGAGFKWQDLGSAADSRGVVPTTASGQVNGAPVGPLNQSPYGAPITFATLATGANSNIMLYTGSFLCATPGIFGVYWAQNASNVSPTILRAGSYLIVTLLSTGSAQNSVQHIYTTAGTFTETIPAGMNKLTIEVWGASGAGGDGAGSNAIPASTAGGGGGGSGGYCRRQNIVVTGFAGSTMNFTVGAAGVGVIGANGTNGTASSVSSGTFTLATLTGNPGQGGTLAHAPPAAGSGGPGGTATGGTTNTTGNSGGAGSSGNVATNFGPGGNGIAGIFSGGTRGGGGFPYSAGFGGGPGGAGVVVFNYTP